MEEKHYDPYTGYEVDGDTPQREETSKDQEQQEGSHGLTVPGKIGAAGGRPKNSDGVGPGYATGFRCGQRAL